MPEKENGRHMIDLLFVLSLFCVFAVSSVVLILFGADIYNKTVSSMNDNYASRTSVAYITEKIRQSDIYESVRIDDSLGYERLLMARNINGMEYATSLYEHNGYLYELFARTDIELPIDAGQQVIALTALDFEFVSDNLLKVSFCDEAQKGRKCFRQRGCCSAGGLPPCDCGGGKPCFRIIYAVPLPHQRNHEKGYAEHPAFHTGTAGRDKAV